jgi:trimeric autotransporter adhesin
MNRALFFSFLSFFAASAQQFVMSTVAGGLPPATPSAAAGASIGDPPRSAVDSAGNVYFAGLHAIFKVDRSGTLQRIAGTGHAGLTGDNGTALAAQISDPVGIAVDTAGNVYYTERTAGLIRRISPSGVIATFASGLSTPMGLLADSAGNLYVAEMGANDVRRISQTGDRAIVAGNGAAAYSGDGGLATAAALNGPEGVALDAAGTLYIADTFNHRVRAVSNGVISTVAGNGSPFFAGDAGKATEASMILPTDVAVDRLGAVYVADLGNSRIRKIANGIISTVAGNAGDTQPINGLPATGVRFSGPTGVAVDSTGAIYIAEGSIGSGSGLDGGIFKIWKVGTDGKLATVAGTGNRSFSGDTGPAALAQFDAPAGMAMDTRGNLYVADSRNNRIRKIATDGTVTTVAGNALPGFSGENGPATLAELNHPSGVAIDAAGNLYIADTGNNRVRLVYPTGIIGTLAGNGNTAFFGDGGVGYNAALNHPEGVAVDEDGTVYIADTGNHRIRRVVSGIIDTIEDGLDAPSSVAVRSGQIAIADRGNGSVRLAGPVNASYALADARGVTIDSGLNVYATGSNRVIKIVFRQPAVTLVGTGQCCYNGDGGPAGAALLNVPWGIVLDPSGNLYIADTGNDAIRMATISASTFFIRAIANSASNVAGAIAPGEIVTIYGAGLGPQNLAVAPQFSPGSVLPTDIAGTSVTFNGIAAPLLYASAGQVSAIVPYAVTGQTATVVVKVSNVSTQAFPAPLAPAVPGVFTADASGVGPARAFNADGSANTPGTQAVVGSAVTLYVTGEGQTAPAGVDGKIAAGAGPAPALPVVVLIGGIPATVQSAAGAAGLPAGVMQVTATVPPGVTGRVPVIVTVGGARSQAGVTIAVE